MGSEVLLRSACELSYEIARDGVESEPAVDPPAAMRSFLYVSELPGRALTVAQQAIEDDPAFRRRVAERADENEVGRAGYLWLHRPIGWAAEFEELSSAPPTNEAELAFEEARRSMDYTIEQLANEGLTSHIAEDAVEEPSSYFGFDEAVAAAPVDPFASDDVAEVEEVPVFPSTDDEDGGVDRVAAADYDVDPDYGDDLDEGALAQPGAASALGFGSVDALGSGDNGLDLSPPETAGTRSEANAIEDELSSLRGLVDRLSSERKAVSGSVRRVEAEVEVSKSQPSMFDSDIYSLQSELEAARAELDDARAERDNAVHQRSESLTRQLELEKELERARELRAEVEREHEEVDSTVVGLKESLARSEASLANVSDERDDLKAQVGEAASTNETLTSHVARLTEDGATEVRTLQSNVSTLQAEVDAIRIERDDLTAKASTLETDLEDATGELTQTSTQATEAKSLVDALTEEKIDLASRLADTEAMLETTRVQLTAVKSDAEAVTADLSNIKAHRDGLAVQVEDLHSSLSEALNDLAKVRSTSDADRAALKEIRAERDSLRVRVGSLEQVETGLEAKLNTLSSERDSIVGRAEQSQTEVTQLQRDLRAAADEKTQLASDLAGADELRSSLTNERDSLMGELESVKGQVDELEAGRDGLQQQVVQLNEENASIQAQLVEADRLRVEAAENQGRALSELAQRLSIVENERARLERDVGEAEGRLGEALIAVDDAKHEANKARAEAERAAPFAAGGVDLAGQAVTSGLGADVTPETAETPRALDGRIDDASGTLAPADGRSSADEPGLDADQPEDELTVPVAEDGFDAGPPIVDPGAGFPAPERPFDDGVGEPEPSSMLEAVDFAPPPPGPLADPPVQPVAEEPSRQRRSKWGIGALRRADNDRRAEEDDLQPAHDGGLDVGVPPPPPPAASDSVRADLMPDPNAVGDEFADDPDSVAAALAQTLNATSMKDSELSEIEAGVEDSDDELEASDAESGSDEAEETAAAVSDDEIDSISTELAQIAGSAPLDPAEDEDLDEISNLISQTVTDFDPVSSEESVEGEAPAEEPVAVATTRSLFADRSEDASRTSGPLPPSVFAEGGGPGGDVLSGTFGSTADVDDGDSGDLAAAFGSPSDAASPDTDDLFPLGDVGDNLKPHRRQIEIPDDVAGDDVEMARYVVSSPDVVLLVDGDSVAKMGWPSLPVAQQRDALVSYLADLAATSGAAPDVVFDGRIGEDEQLPSSRAVRIRLSTPPSEPAAALDELVDRYPDQWPVAIVTDDGSLARSASDRGATVLSNGQLLDLFLT